MVNKGSIFMDINVTGDLFKATVNSHSSSISKTRISVKIRSLFVFLRSNGYKKITLKCWHKKTKAMQIIAWRSRGYKIRKDA